MQTRALGPNGPTVSAIGVGAMSFGPFYGETTEAESHAILYAALDAGVDHIDTSNVYAMGRSEEVIGRYLAKRKGPPPFRIATKGGIAKDRQTGKRKFDNSAFHLEAELDKSLMRLGVEQVELYYIHRRDPDVPIEEATGTLADLVAKGKISRFGFSEIAPTSLRRATAVHPVAAVQSEYSLQTSLPELGSVQACEDLGTALVAFSPVGRGLLTDRPPTAQKVAESDFLNANPPIYAGPLVAQHRGQRCPSRHRAGHWATYGGRWHRVAPADKRYGHSNSWHSKRGAFPRTCRQRKSHFATGRSGQDRPSPTARLVPWSTILHRSIRGPRRLLLKDIT